MTSLDLTIAAAAALALNGTGSFIHESQAQATLTANNAALPAIIYATATTSQQTASSRVESATVSVYFAAATSGPGDDAAATYATQEQMHLLKRRFLAVLDTGALVQVDGIKATPMTGLYEAVLDGIGCQFTLTVPAAPLLVRCLPGYVPPGQVAPTVTSATFVGDAPVQVAPTVTAATFVAA